MKKTILAILLFMSTIGFAWAECEIMEPDGESDVEVIDSGETEKRDILNNNVSKKFETLNTDNKSDTKQTDFSKTNTGVILIEE